MRVLLIYKLDQEDQKVSGVLQKMYDQKNAFEKLKHEVHLTYIKGKTVFIDDKTLQLPEKSRGFQIKNLLFFQILTEYLNGHKYDLIYIRYPYSTPYFIKFLSQIKKANGTCKIIIEVPTYPYEKEFKGIKKISLLIDTWFRKGLKKYTDRIVLIGQKNNLWGIETIQLSNGINTDQIIPSKSKRKDGIIRLLAVGNWQTWHGLDRIVKGLERYYAQDRKVIITLDVVGEGTPIKELVFLVKQLKLEKYIFFHGQVSQNHLFKYYDTSDICVGNLGNHRLGLSSHAPLKHREYCLAGLPFIFSTPDSDFSDELDFITMFPADESDIDCIKIIELYKKTAGERDKIISYAVNNLSWVSRIEYILSRL